ncbi:MAG: type II secretion system protein GspD [Alphaproteobacteria bacterium]
MVFAYLSSCRVADIDPFDFKSKLSRGDIKDLLLTKPDHSKIKKNKEKEEAVIPNVTKLIISPPPPVLGGDKIVTFSVTDQAPLKDVLIELARMANIDIDIDPAISGGVIINAKNRPLKEVIDRIANQAGLRYSYKNGILYFQRDMPFMKNYYVDYIGDGSVWGDVESNISAVLTAEASSSDSGSGGAESSYTTNKSAGIISLFATERQHKAVEKYLQDVDKYASAQVLIEAKVVEVTLSDSFRAGINWNWLNSIPKSNVPYSIVQSSMANFDAVASAGVRPTIFTLGSSTARKGLFGGSLDMTIQALEEFGTTKTISSPRIHAMNNQQASLSFQDKLIYFKIETTQSQTGANSGGGGAPNNVITTSSTSTKMEENIGVEIAITPSINLKTNEVTMTVQPTLAVKSGEVKDPVNPANIVPIIQTRTLSTIAKVLSGNVLVIGGLMRQDSANQDSGLPFLSRIPILGALFKVINRRSDVVETVIFIKATIVNSSTGPIKEDKDFQEKFDAGKRRYIN